MAAAVPLCYTHFRITVAHERGPDIIRSVFNDLEWYIAYPHSGKNGDNEHYHVNTPELNNNGRERIRARIKTAVGSGNKFLSVKSFKNGLRKGIQYGSKEGTTPLTRGDVQQWIDDTDPWIPGLVDRPRKRKRRVYVDPEGEEHVLGIIVNKYNLVQIAAHFYRKHHPPGNEGAEWRNTINAMLASHQFDFQFSDKPDILMEIFFRQEAGLDTPDRVLNALLGFDTSTLD